MSLSIPRAPRPSPPFSVNLDRGDLVCGRPANERMIYVVFGVLIVTLGIVQLVFARQILVLRASKRKTVAMAQNPRGRSLAMTRFAGVVPILGGLFLGAFGMSQVVR